MPKTSSNRFQTKDGSENKRSGEESRPLLENESGDNCTNLNGLQNAGNTKTPRNLKVKCKDAFA